MHFDEVHDARVWLSTRLDTARPRRGIRPAASIRIAYLHVRVRIPVDRRSVFRVSRKNEGTGEGMFGVIAAAA